MLAEALALEAIGVGAAAALFALADLWRIAREPRLPVASPTDRAPSVSVLVPARNESRGIDALLAGLASQTLAPLEVVVVDDASEDDTAAKVRAWVQTGRLDGLRLIEGKPLPAGWVGKCWALAQAAEVARGDRFLFLDGDVVPEPALVASLVTALEREKLDAVTGLPRTALHGLLERLVLPAFHAVLFGLYPVARVGTDARFALINGQCWLVRRAIYERLGGHHAVRGSVLEDVHLAERLVAAGHRLRAFALSELLTARGYADSAALREGMSKHALAGFRSGGLRSVWVGFRELVLALAPLALVVHPSWPAALGAALAFVRAGVLYRRRYRASVSWGVSLWLGTAIYFGLATRAFLRARSPRGLTWKGRLVRPERDPGGSGGLAESAPR